ncbi:MAG: serine hydrolase [Verrucomicrobiales bacterium]|nr:serine hydrolase [Verrucomicrobiales bacterium]
MTALGLAMADGKITLSDKAIKHIPSLAVPPKANNDTGWIDEISINHFATQTARFLKPGSYEAFVLQPGTQWHYSDGGPNWLAE